MSNAQDTLMKARKKASGGGNVNIFGFGLSMSSSTSRMEEARELFRQAANEFKQHEQWKDSGDAFCEAAECSVKVQEDWDAAVDYWDAAKAYKKSHPTLSVAALRKCIEMHVRKGKFRNAADRSKDMAIIFATDELDLEAALEAYEQAGKWYDMEESPALANACFKDGADIAIKLEKYSVAKTRFEEVAIKSLANPVTRYSVKDYFFKAGLCHLCEGDLVCSTRAFSDYASKDPTFVQSREYKLLMDIANAIEAGDQQTFTDRVKEFDTICRLDDLKTRLLLKIKHSIVEEPDLL